MQCAKKQYYDFCDFLFLEIKMRFCTAWKFLENWPKYHHKLPNCWILLRFCLRFDQNAFQKILWKWKKVFAKKNVVEIFVRKLKIPKIGYLFFLFFQNLAILFGPNTEFGHFWGGASFIHIWPPLRGRIFYTNLATFWGRMEGREVCTACI